MHGKRGAIFDWDGVILNSAAHHETSWERLARELNKTLPEGHFKRGFGMKNEAIFPEVLRWTADPVEIRIFSLRKEAIYRDVVREVGVTALPGVEPWLRTLRDAGIPCVIASSTHRENITTTLAVLGLGDFFADIVSAEDVKRGQARSRSFPDRGETDRGRAGWRRGLRGRAGRDRRGQGRRDARRRRDHDRAEGKAGPCRLDGGPAR